MKLISLQMKNLYFLGLVFFFTPYTSFAFFCPTNFNQISDGQTTNQVIQQCGKPFKIETRTVKPEGPQEWSYYIPQTVSTGAALSQMQGTLKTQMTFDTDGKVINISVNGIGVGATTICGQNIQLGSTKEMIMAACGKPAFINRQDTSDPNIASGTPPPMQVTEFSYMTSTGSIVKLTFENGMLKGGQ